MNFTEDKKVEYIELIYDLIFVYLVGRSASLLDRIEGGFLSFATFADYIVSSLIFLQIWYHSTLYINRYGRNGTREHMTLLINMFLLYIMGTNTIHGWNVNYYAYMGAWILILVNLAVSYLGERRRATEDECVRRHAGQQAALLLIQAGAVAVTLPVYAATGRALGQWAMLISYAAAPFLRRVPVNFEHLTERVMLYVVFTFGEMVIIVAEYFTGGFSLTVLYYALMSFLIVAGLFFSYGFMYDRLLDREGEKPATWYMLLHIFLILGLSCVTTAMEFMREPEVRAMPKTVMMVISLLVFYLCLALTEHWSVRRFRRPARFHLLLLAGFAVFAAIMVLTSGSGVIGIAVTVLFIYAQLWALIRAEKHTEQRTPERVHASGDVE